MANKCARIKIEACILALSAITIVFGPIRLPSAFYYGVVAFMLIKHLFSGRTLGLNRHLMLLICVAATSLLINNPPAVFRSWERLGAFIMVVALISPLLKLERLELLKQLTFKYSLYILSILSILSFPSFFLGINFMVRENLDYLSQVGGYGGLYIHSMILGPASAMSSIFLLSLLINELEKKKRRVVKILFFAASLFSTVYATFLSASRTAVWGLVIVMVVLLFRYYASSINRTFKMLLYIVIVALCISPFIGNMSERVMTKQSKNIDSGDSSFTSRHAKWQARISEFESSPIIGVGFAAIDADFGDKVGDDGGLEPGSSYLGVLSMMGILGFVTFISFYLKQAISAYKRIRYSSYHFTVAGIILFFGLSMVTEGYVFAAGSYLFFMLWLTIGNVETK